MAGAISKNARREGEKILTSRWGGQIKTKSVFENGKLAIWCVIILVNPESLGRIS